MGADFKEAQLSHKAAAAQNICGKHTPPEYFKGAKKGFRRPFEKKSTLF
jgi:hypothetical protein